MGANSRKRTRLPRPDGRQVARHHRKQGGQKTKPKEGGHSIPYQLQEKTGDKTGKKFANRDRPVEVVATLSIVPAATKPFQHRRVESSNVTTTAYPTAGLKLIPLFGANSSNRASASFFFGHMPRDCPNQQFETQKLLLFKQERRGKKKHHHIQRLPPHRQRTAKETSASRKTMADTTTRGDSGQSGSNDMIFHQSSPRKTWWHRVAAVGSIQGGNVRGELGILFVLAHPWGEVRQKCGWMSQP